MLYGSNLADIFIILRQVFDERFTDLVGRLRCFFIIQRYALDSGFTDLLKRMRRLAA
jgi:hypothetical protein